MTRLLALLLLTAASAAGAAVTFVFSTEPGPYPVGVPHRAKMRPGSHRPRLAEAYEAAGERQLAIDEYRRALTIEPTLGHSIERLKALGAEPLAKASGG